MCVFYCLCIRCMRTIFRKQKLKNKNIYNVKQNRISNFKTFFKLNNLNNEQCYLHDTIYKEKLCEKQLTRLCTIQSVCVHGKYFLLNDKKRWLMSDRWECQSINYRYANGNALWRGGIRLVLLWLLFSS